MYLLKSHLYDFTSDVFFNMKGLYMRSNKFMYHSDFKAAIIIYKLQD